jgi:hypothetical protein
MRLIRILVCLAVLAACAPTTEVLNSWADPSAGQVRFKKMLNVCACKDEAMRRTVEDQLTKRITGSTPSYTVLSETDLQDRESAKAKVKAGGYDGAVVMVLVSVDRTQTYVPGSAYAVPAPYTSMYGGWGYGWSTYYDPGYVDTDQLVDFNTNVYQVEGAKLIWASRTQTTDPTSVGSMVDEIISANIAEMKRQKVLTD